MDRMPAGLQAEWLAFDLAMHGAISPRDPPPDDTPPEFTDPRDKFAWMLERQ